jgi:hypothetical protein
LIIKALHNLICLWYQGITEFYGLVMWYYYNKLNIHDWEDINTLEGQFINSIEQLDYYYNPIRPGYKYKDVAFIKKLITFLKIFFYIVIWLVIFININEY